MNREIWEVTAPTVQQAKAKALELFGTQDGAGLSVEILSEGNAAQGYASVRQLARVRAERKEEGFGMVSRELPEALPQAPPVPKPPPLRRMTLSGGKSGGRAMPKPDLVLTETPPPPRVARQGIEPSHAREREIYVPTDEHNRRVEAVVEEVMQAMGISCETRYEHAEFQRIFITVGEEDAGTLIGRRGSGVDALEHILSRMISQRCESHVPVQVDVNAYREREQQRLEEEAREAAEEARRTGDEIHFEPMSPRERRVVHLAVQDLLGIRTYTVGESRRRHVVVVYEENKSGNNS